MTNPTVAAQWREQFDEFARSGLSVERYCMAHDVSEYRCYYWRRMLSAAQTSTQDGGPNWFGDADAATAEVGPA